jgi:exopolysaccharide biosynthesis WecB/TagA/CpsF family protein
VAVGLAMAGMNGSSDAQRDILGVRLADMSRPQALETLLSAIRERKHLKVAFCNAHTANTAYGNPAFQQALQRFLVLPDGIGVDIAAQWLGGRRFQANLNGTDFVPELLRQADRPLRLALIGGRPGVAERAAAALTALGCGHDLVACIDGFSDPDATADWLSDLEASPADIMLVAMGNPKQELWISTHVDARHATVAIGVGALFDFLAGEVSRAPRVVRQLRLEWAWRLMLEPKRLFRRYVLGNPLFLARVMVSRLRRRPA